MSEHQPWWKTILIFAINISKRGSYFEAYSITLNDLLLENHEIHALIEEEINDNHEFLQRLGNQDIDFKLMAHSGSAVFFQ